MGIFPYSVMNTFISKYLKHPVPIEPLVLFRILFGLLMCFSALRFWYYGWIEKLYIEPSFFFSYYGFEWVKPLGNYTYILFIIYIISSLLIAIGYRYRFAIVTFFLCFTYIELMDKTTYLNHYYFISLVSFVMIFLPLNKAYALDSYLKKVHYTSVPSWTINSIKLLLGIVYFYAGIAKLNSDWLFKAMPLKIWLPSKYDFPLIGNNLLQQEWFHYAMSWSGMLYDVAIPFLLLYKRTRIFGFVLVIIFHVFTRALFPIGMFPYIMIFSTLIFFDPKFHKNILQRLGKLGPKLFRYNPITTVKTVFKPKAEKVIVSMLVIFFAIQLLLPFRYLAYPGELFWTEEGYRFSWRVMLMEKQGHTTFKIVDKTTGAFFYVDNSDFLSSFQEKQMAFQPDFILKYAHYLGDHFTKQGHKNVQVFADSYVALNGRLSQPYIDPNVDLYQQKESFKHKQWILPFKDTINGL